MIKRKKRKQRQRLRNPRRKTNQKMGRVRPMRLKKLQTRRQSPRRRTRRQSSTTPVHPSVHPSVHPFPFLSFIFLSLSQFSLSLSSSLNNLLSAHHHQRNIFISEFVNTGSGF